MVEGEREGVGLGTPSTTSALEKGSRKLQLASGAGRRRLVASQITGFVVVEGEREGVGLGTPSHSPNGPKEPVVTKGFFLSKKTPGR